MFVSRGLVVGFAVALAGLVLTGCGTRLNKAPVEDRGTSSSSPANSAAQPGVVVGAPVKPLPGAENAGKAGYYTVKPGDTLIRIGLETGQSWKDIARWNNLDNANLIEVGQVLRVAPPAPASQAVASDTGVVTRPVTSSTVTPAAPASTPVPPASATKPAASAASGAVVAVAPRVRSGARRSGQACDDPTASPVILRPRHGGGE
jgi:lipoprotein NlpD